MALLNADEVSEDVISGEDRKEKRTRGRGSKVSRTSMIHCRLLPKNDERLNRLSRLENKPRSEIVREAVNYYLDSRENNLLQDRESSLEKLIKKSVNRLAALQVRTAIDTGVIYNLCWQYSPDESRSKTFLKAYRESVDRHKGRLTKQAEEFKEILEH